MSQRRKSDEEPEEDAPELDEVVEPDAAPEPDVEPEPTEEPEPTPEPDEDEEPEGLPEGKRPTIVPEGVAPTNPAAFQQAVDADPGRTEGGVWVEGGTLTYSDPSAVPDDREPAKEQADVEPRTFTSRDPNPEE